MIIKVMRKDVAQVSVITINGACGIAICLSMRLTCRITLVDTVKSNYYVAGPRMTSRRRRG